MHATVYAVVAAWLSLNPPAPALAIRNAKDTYRYGEHVQLTLSAAGHPTGYYYISLETVDRDGYWGPADEDIQERMATKDLHFRALRPTTIDYSTGKLDVDFVAPAARKDARYRFTLCYTDRQASNAPLHKVSTRDFHIRK